MKLRICSDIHSEFWDDVKGMGQIVLPEMEGDADSTLILAGDVGSMHSPENLVGFIDEVAPRFKNVLYVLGNHEFYGGNLDRTPEDISEMLRHHDNIVFAPGIDNIHMETLWTDFDKENPISMIEAATRMNDYQYIHDCYLLARPEDMVDLHKRAVESFSVICEGDIVITHHAPSYQSVPEEYKTSRVNGAYASDLELLILEKKPILWVHGHTHTPCDYMIGNTRVVCNPRGYGNQFKKNGYNSKLVIEV